MWKLYIMLGLCTQSLTAQQDVAHIRNSRGGSGRVTFNTADLYVGNGQQAHLTSRNNENHNSTIIHAVAAANRIYNSNSRNSFANASTLAEAHLIPLTTEIQIQQTTDTHNLTTNLSTNTATSESWKIPTGNSFNSKLMEVLMSSDSQHENLVYSPISLQTILAFIFTTSGGRLYDELAQLLTISSNRTYVAKTFENIVQATALNMSTTTLIMANKLYYDHRFGPIDPAVRNFAKKSFTSEMEQIDFTTPKKAAEIINAWVSERTRDLINDIVTPSTISGDASALLLNSLYFKGEWLTKFATYDTELQDFFTTKETKIAINMMYNEDVFRYGDFPDDLQASVVELPYKDSKLSMLLILPTDIDGLPELERKLKYYDLESLTQKIKRETVIVKLPRFKIEYEIDMIKPLKLMGLNALFNNAGSINLFKTQQKPVRIDQFKHKCFINVNEAGTEAAAASVGKYVPLSIPSNMKYFVANHPFVFIIRDPNNTFFIGHVAQF